MLENNKDACQTLEWIIQQSEDGMFLAVAEESVQKEVMECFRNEKIGIFDCSLHAGTYKFRLLSEWIESLGKMQNFLIFNFQMAMRDVQDFKRLNFSRDMLAGLKKNLVFFTTAYGDDRLVSEAYDFYSFLKMRILFRDNYAKQVRTEWEMAESHSDIRNDIMIDYAMTLGEQESDSPMLVLQKSKTLLERAEEAKKRYLYYYAELCLLGAERYRKKILGPEHLEMAEIYHSLGEIYEEVKEYEKSEKFYRRALHIREEVLDRLHPDAIDTYKSLIRMYKKQGAYEKIRELKN